MSVYSSGLEERMFREYIAIYCIKPSPGLESGLSGANRSKLGKVHRRRYFAFMVSVSSTHPSLASKLNSGTKFM